MPQKAPEAHYHLDIPRPFNRRTEYACWLMAHSKREKRLLASIARLDCVRDLRRHRPTGRVLIEISDDHDPDEAWHWIQHELYDADSFVELDPIWEEAIRWIL
jgi:hypothetical protein